MKITRIDTWAENLKLTRPYTIAYKTMDAVENAFVRIETDSGHVGLGAASPSEYVCNETFEMCLEALNGKARPLLLGEDVRRAGRWQRLLNTEFTDTPGAQAALDMALLDLFAQWLELPLVDVLGRAHETLPTSITIGIKSLAETLEEADEYLGRGFRIIKLKIGKDVDADIETTRRLHARLKGRMKIRVDANQGYSPADLVRYYQATRDHGLELIEQPVPQLQPQLMIEVPEAVRAVCAGDETIRRPSDALQCAAHPQPFGIYNIKLMKSGGVSPAMDIARVAELAGIDLMWGCMDESIISITAALHAAFASPATRYIDLDGSLDLARDVAAGGFILAEGMMRLPDAPGLGVRLNDRS